MSKKRTLSLFQGYGIELEYMIVSRKTLAVMPISDLVLKEMAGEIIGEVDLEHTAWSNELVMHVLEMKTRGPAPSLEGLSGVFQQDVVRLNELLAKHDAMLLPTAMHPFFDPETETRLWPHDNAVVYATYNKIFDCRGHGWSNLQSMHINLPFNGDDEFGRLHAAIRLVLPILPALAASSPMWGGAYHGFLDHRLEFYRHNQKRVPSISGKVIPERAFTKKEYEDKIFARIFADIAPHDPEGTLQDEWLNSRGAIARFDRNAIEIRLLDLQESPRMDLAVATMVVSVVKGLVDGRFASQDVQRAVVEDKLSDIFVACVKDADQAVVKDPAYLKLWGMAGEGPVAASTIWRHLYTELKKVDHYGLGACSKELQVLLERGPLARRILNATGPSPKPEVIHKVYHALAQTLANGGMFDGATSPF
jgi:carboxylate-amine ligase